MGVAILYEVNDVNFGLNLYGPNATLFIHKFSWIILLLLIIEVWKPWNENVLFGCNNLGAKHNEIISFYI